MTEEIIIFEQDGDIVGITKEGKYFESYKTTENVAILRGAGLYIKRLEQENKELKEKVKELDKMTGIFSARLCNKYRSALEDIREELCYGRTFYEGYFDSENLSRTDKVIKKINEVLK